MTTRRKHEDWMSDLHDRIVHLPAYDTSALTRREFETAKRRSKGHSVREVAGQMGIEYHSAGSNEKEVHSKLGLHNSEQVTLALVFNNKLPATPQLLTRWAEIYKTLTPREREVMHCRAQGLTVDGTAAELGISRGTVGDYDKAVHRKFGIHTSMEVARIWGSLKRDAHRALGGSPYEIVQEAVPARAAVAATTPEPMLVAGTIQLDFIGEDRTKEVVALPLPAPESNLHRASVRRGEIPVREWRRGMEWAAGLARPDQHAVRKPKGAGATESTPKPPKVPSR